MDGAPPGNEPLGLESGHPLVVERDGRERTSPPGLTPVVAAIVAVASASMRRSTHWSGSSSNVLAGTEHVTEPGPAWTTCMPVKRNSGGCKASGAMSARTRSSPGSPAMPAEKPPRTASCHTATTNMMARTGARRATPN